ncbi:MAG: pyruvate kinase, partial [Alloscardovia omnicolens]|nr:pyruvate kinase [Alloscardovia omnicolens]
MRKAKIVDTIGPASSALETLKEMVNAGMNVARINRSHGTFEEHMNVYNNVRQAAQETGKNVAVLVDLQGPKIRCGWVEEDANGDDKVWLEQGQDFVITTDEVTGNKERVSTTFKGLPGDCHPGDPILIDDGKVQLEVVKVEGNDVHTKVVVAGPVSSHKGLNLPGVAVSVPALSEKDEEDLRWGIRTGADIIAMSFVRFGTDIERAHEIMD